MSEKKLLAAGSPDYFPLQIPLKIYIYHQKPQRFIDAIYYYSLNNFFCFVFTVFYFQDGLSSGVCTGLSTVQSVSSSKEWLLFFLNKIAFIRERTGSGILNNLSY